MSRIIDFHWGYVRNAIRNPGFHGGALLIMHTTRMTTVPAMRTHDLVTTTSKDEVLVYDQAAHHIHHLNAPAAQVWYLCDGVRTVADLAIETGLTQDAVKLALRTLEEAKLLDGPLASDLRGTQSRRAFMKKAAIAGAVPAIISVSAPIAAAATSHVDCNVGETCNVVNSQGQVTGRIGELRIVGEVCLCVAV
jgi:hypothetical protein